MGRAPCCSKNSDLNRGAWTAQEDLILSQYIKTHGEGRWRSIPQKAGLKRCGKSCRLRWLNYLRPDIKRGDISPDEEDLIVRLHGLLGNRWSLIAGRLPSRTDNEIKNFWNTHLRKKCQLSVPEKEGSRKLKAAPPADDQHVFKSTPVKATAVRIKKGYRKYGSTSSDDGTSMEKNVIKSSQSSSMEIDGHYSPCYSYKPTSSSVDYQIPHSYEPCEDSGVDTFQSLLSMDELSSPDFDACTTTDITQLLDHDNTQLVNSFIASDDQANIEMQEKEDWVEEEKEDWVEELQHQQKSSLQWLSLLLLESEEDWEEKNNRESVSVI